jgi:hypothetical protein
MGVRRQLECQQPALGSNRSGASAMISLTGSDPFNQLHERARQSIKRE